MRNLIKFLRTHPSHEGSLRLRLIAWLMPAEWRLVEVLHHVTDPDMAASDLVRGGDALARGWGCDPEILFNGAHVIQAMKRDQIAQDSA